MTLLTWVLRTCGEESPHNTDIQVVKGYLHRWSAHNSAEEHLVGNYCSQERWQTRCQQMSQKEPRGKASLGFMKPWTRKLFRAMTEMHSELLSTWQNLIARVGYLISLAGHTSRCSVSSLIPVKLAITPPWQPGSQFKKRKKKKKTLLELKFNTCEDSFGGTCSIAWHDEVDLERQEQTGKAELQWHEHICPHSFLLTLIL